MNENGKFALMEKSLVAQVISALKGLDVRGYESNETRTDMVRMFVGLLNAPGLDMEPKKPAEGTQMRAGHAESRAEDAK